MNCFSASWEPKKWLITKHCLHWHFRAGLRTSVHSRWPQSIIPHISHHRSCLPQDQNCPEPLRLTSQLVYDKWEELGNVCSLFQHQLTCSEQTHHRLVTSVINAFLCVLVCALYIPPLWDIPDSIELFLGFSHKSFWVEPRQQNRWPHSSMDSDENW